MDRPGFVYIMVSRRNGTLYIGVTDDLPRRAWEHREGLVPGFTKRYDCKLLVWYAAFDNIHDARRREKQMKEWRRAWKVELIEATNPYWADLFPSLSAV